MASVPQSGQAGGIQPGVSALQTTIGYTPPATIDGDTIGPAVPSLADFGARALEAGDSPAAVLVKAAKNAAAIQKAFAASNDVLLPARVFPFADGIEIPSRCRLIGAAAPTLAPFPLTGDDKVYLRPGYKHLIPGSVLLFVGTGKATITSPRTDRFASATYCVKIGGGTGLLRDIGIVLDVDVYDAAGAFTTTATDNRAVYGVGLWLQDFGFGEVENVTVFGYFPTAGTVHTGADPDDTNLWHLTTMGDIGLAIVGTNSAGLSGTNLFGCHLHANDHHSRGTSPTGTNALYIDGAVGSKGIGGHKMYGGTIRTYAEVPIQFGTLYSAKFDGTKMEFPNPSGGPELTKILGTSTTGPLAFTNCRWTDNPIYGSGKLLESLGSTGGPVYITDGPAYQGMEIASGLGCVRLQMRAAGDAVLQLAGDSNGSNNGWTMSRDASAAGALSVRNDNVEHMIIETTGDMTLPVDRKFTAGALDTRRVRRRMNSTNLVIAAGSITPIWGMHTVDTDGSASAELTTIDWPGVTAGEELILLQAATARMVIVRGDAAAGGNIRGPQVYMPIGPSFGQIAFRYDGGFWRVVSYHRGLGAAAWAPPYGTTSQRPATPEAGMFRANTTTGYPEVWSVQNDLWVPIGGPMPRPAILEGPSLTIATDIVTVTHGLHVVRTEAAATTDNLVTINGGFDGALLTLKTGLSSESVVLKNTGGNIRIGTDRTINNLRDSVTMIYRGGFWELWGGFFDYA